MSGARLSGAGGSRAGRAKKTFGLALKNIWPPWPLASKTRPESKNWLTKKSNSSKQVFKFFKILFKDVSNFILKFLRYNFQNSF